ncbi:hypothetical protein [Aeromicrobium stalagmiti]|uniref:hypothetical protein n=1 Tax=Aeromicrobium stalagmiti TaxID=2738988 RepID=UPI001569CE98|nr:hypothetical protein [Aeromicrobium stalagmiti]NRQ49656.1 hypothetical protein [Aeromicrobium stalagmiti]
MSDDAPKYPSEEPQQPNWGSAYPPPASSYPPPGSSVPPSGYGYPPGYPPQPGSYPPGYPPPPGYGYPAYGPQAPKHPQATTAMVLGIVGVGGGMLCYGLPLLVAPFAWFQGRRAMRDIDASQGQLSGRSEAKAGFVLGIIGTVLLTLVLAVITLIVVLSFTVDDFWGDDSSSGSRTDSVDALATVVRAAATSSD